MIPFKHFAVTAALAAVAACAGNSSSTEPTDLSKKAQVVIFDVKGMT